MPQVSLSEGANISRLETPYGVISRRGTITVPSEWALLKIKDNNLMFVFEESDREDVSKTDEKTLAILSRVLGEELKTSFDLESLILPKKKGRKPVKTSTKATPKKSKLEE
tara:strand:- start:2893 stop:3225 length:333 start_codon:yes stop_codon:yes gene_type:complete